MKNRCQYSILWGVNQKCFLVVGVGVLFVDSFGLRFSRRHARIMRLIYWCSMPTPFQEPLGEFGRQTFRRTDKIVSDIK